MYKEATPPKIRSVRTEMELTPIRQAKSKLPTTPATPECMVRRGDGYEARRSPGSGSPIILGDTSPLATTPTSTQTAATTTTIEERLLDLFGPSPTVTPATSSNPRTPVPAAVPQRVMVRIPLQRLRPEGIPATQRHRYLLKQTPSGKKWLTIPAGDLGIAPLAKITKK